MGRKKKAEPEVLPRLVEGKQKFKLGDEQYVEILRDANSKLSGIRITKSAKSLYDLYGGSVYLEKGAARALRQILGTNLWGE